MKNLKKYYIELGGWNTLKSGEWLAAIINKSFRNYWERATADPNSSQISAKRTHYILKGGRKKMRRLLCWVTVAFVCVTAKISESATLDDLKGLSIQIMMQNRNTVHTPPDERYYVVRPRVERRIYVSVKGNIFDYTELSTDPGPKWRMQAMSGLERAMGGSNQSPGGGRLHAWTMIDGRLTSVAELLAGFRVTTITVDPIRLTCTVDSRDEPDAKTGTVWQISPITGTPMEIRLTVESYTCIIKKGNIFASYQ